MSFVTTDDGTTLWWEAVGRGEPLLLIQGLGYPSDMWYRVIGPLSVDHRVIRFDNRGVGRSDVPAGPYPIPRMVADAMAVLSAAGETSAHVFGVSMGGIIAQELVLTHPDAETYFDAVHRAGPMRALALARGDDYMAELRTQYLERAPAGAWTHHPRARLIVVRRPPSHAAAAPPTSG